MSAGSTAVARRSGTSPVLAVSGGAGLLLSAWVLAGGPSLSTPALTVGALVAAAVVGIVLLIRAVLPAGR